MSTEAILKAVGELNQELETLLRDPYKLESEVYLNPGLKKHLEELQEAIQQLRKVLGD